LTRVRVDDLEKASRVLGALGLNATSSIVEAMRRKVTQRESIAWTEMQSFLHTFEEEATKKDPTCHMTFRLMEGILMKALNGAQSRTRTELKKRGLSAPDVDRHIDALDSGLSSVHAEIHFITHPPEAIRLRRLALFLMFGHVVRWQALEDFARRWVGHWGKGLDKKTKNDAIAALLTLKIVKDVKNVLMSDTQLYRDAIAHGGFEFVDDQQLNFWNRDKRGVKHDLPPLNVADLLGLYNMSEKRLRTMEAFARVFRAWGRHSSPLVSPARSR